MEIYKKGDWVVPLNENDYNSLHKWYNTKQYYIVDKPYEVEDVDLTDTFGSYTVKIGGNCIRASSLRYAKPEEIPNFEPIFSIFN